MAGIKRIEFTPDPELLARFPEISGNTVNGFGETRVRRASPFFWHPPERQTHGELSTYVLDQFASQRPGGSEWGDVGGRGADELPPVADTQTIETPEEHSAARAFALANEADMVGMTEMQDTWVYEGYEIAERNVIVLGVGQAHLFHEVVRNLDLAPLDAHHRLVHVASHQRTADGVTLLWWRW